MPSAYLAQDQFVLFDKINLVAERFLSFRLASFSRSAVTLAPVMMPGDFVRIPSFAFNMAAQQEGEKSFEAMAMMPAVAISARATFNIGGRIANFVWDKAKSAWKEENNSPLTMAVESDRLTQESISMLFNIPDKETDATDDDPDKDLQKKKWVTQGIARLEKQNLELKQRTDEQGRLIIHLNKAIGQTPRQQRPQTDDHGQEGKGEDLLYTRHDFWPPGGMNGRDALQVPDQRPQTTLLAHDHDREHEIQNVVKVYANHVREFEVKGEIVIINNINVVNKVLVHDWGKRLREELGRSNTNVRITKAEALQDVRMAGRVENCATLTNRIVHSMQSFQSSSPSEQSVYVGMLAG